MLRPTIFASLLVLALAACASSVEDASTGGGGSGTASTPAATTTDATTGNEGSGGSPGTTTTTSVGEASGTGPGGGAPDGCADDAPYTSRVPKAPPTGAQSGAGGGLRLAVSRWYLGDTRRNGQADTRAWEDFGFDLDAVGTGDLDGDERMSAADIVCVCSSQGGEINAGNLADGPGGLDNSFGKNVVPFLQAILPDPSELLTEAIVEGDATVAFDLPTLSDETEADPIGARYWPLRDRAGDLWQWDPAYIAGDPDAPLLPIADGYVSGRTWVSGVTDRLVVPLRAGGLALHLTLHRARISMDLDAQGTAASGGVIVGTLDTDEFVNELGIWLPTAFGGQEGVCPGDQLFESIVQNVRAASDIGADGTQQAGTICSGISIALGFDATAVAIDGIAQPEEPLPSPCE